MSKGRLKDAGTEGSISTLEEVAAKHEYELKEGAWLEPGLALFA